MADPIQYVNAMDQNQQFRWKPQMEVVWKLLMKNKLKAVEGE
jgi:hypothetical protein